MPQPMKMPKVPEERQCTNFSSNHLIHDVLLAFREEVSAERSLAEVRHQEILAALQDRMLALHSRLDRQTMTAAEGTDNQKCERQSLDECDLGCDREHMVGLRASKLFEQMDARSSQAMDSFEEKLGLSSKKAANDPGDSRGSDYIRCRIRKITSLRRFEIATAGLIFMNALIMCFEVQRDGLVLGRKLKYADDGESTSDVWPGSDTAFAFFDWVFGAMFLAEAVLKLVGFGFTYFFSVWNVIDFTCVFAFVVDKAATALNATFLDAQVVRLMRLFRLVRLVRLIRTLEKFEMLYIMTTAMKGMTMIVVWAMSLLAVILMTCALFLASYLHSSYFDGIDPGATSAELSTQRELYKYFGTFSRCMFSMFELTLANWPPVARLLSEEVGEGFSVICILYKLTIGFAVVGVINGVVLQETFHVAHTDDMVMVRQKKRAKEALQKKMGALFQALDVNHDGTLAFSEFLVIAAQPEVRLWLASLDIETDDLLTLFLLLDADGDGTLTLEELLAHIPRLRGSARGIDMLAVRKGIPSFHLLQQDDERSPMSPTSSRPSDFDRSFERRCVETKYLWAPSQGPSQNKLGAIGRAKFTWGTAESNKNATELDEALAQR